MTGAAADGWKPEIELKFAVSPGTAGSLLRYPPLAFARDLGERHVESAYYDTAEMRLQKDGVALRVRRTDDSYVQTAKMFHPARHTAFRLERDDPLDGPRPRAALLHQATGSRHVTLGDDDLVLAFRTRINRRILMLDNFSGAHRGSRIEVAIDNGFVETAARSEAMSEIELELVEGPIADLYALALSLHRQMPLAIEVFSKSQRGFALSGGKPPPWRKADDIDLEALTSLDETIARVMARCYEHWMNNQAAALDGRDIEGVHQMRVALRRLRAALGFFAPWLPDAQMAWFRREVKWIAGYLGRARDLDVLDHDTMGPLRKACHGDRDLDALDDCIRSRRDEAYRQLAPRIGSPRYTTVVLTLGQWIAQHGWRSENPALDGPVTRHARSALDQAFGQVMSRGADFEAMSEIERHDLRLDIKRLRYAMQFVGSAYDGAKPWLQVLGRLQDALGIANDAALADALIGRCTKPVVGNRKRRSIARARGLVSGWWLAKASEQESLSRSLWREFTDLEPFWRSS